jgi:glycine dehydrogenase subunit 2
MEESGMEESCMEESCMEESCMEESEDKFELDAFCDTMLTIAREAEEIPAALHHAPILAPLRRLDETTAARKPVLRWQKPATLPA